MCIRDRGYTYDSTTGDPLTGTMNGNKVINVWYVAEDTDITDPEVPGGELPENPDGGDGTDPGTDPGTDITDPEAVSYTHLDVYKRQAMETRWSLRMWAKTGR